MQQAYICIRSVRCSSCCCHPPRPPATVCQHQMCLTGWLPGRVCVWMSVCCRGGGVQAFGSHLHMHCCCPPCAPEPRSHSKYNAPGIIQHVTAPPLKQSQRGLISSWQRGWVGGGEIGRGEAATMHGRLKGDNKSGGGAVREQRNGKGARDGKCVLTARKGSGLERQVQSSSQFFDLDLCAHVDRCRNFRGDGLGGVGVDSHVAKFSRGSCRQSVRRNHPAAPLSRCISVP